MSKGKKTIEGILAVILLFSSVFFWAPHFLKAGQADELEVIFLNVGQGDAILLRSPDGYIGMIDAGSGSNVLAELSTALPYWQRRLDFALVTHPDADHLEGYREMLQRYRIDMLFWQKMNKKTALYQDVASLVAETKVKNYQLNSETDFRLGCCVYFDVIWPFAGEDIYNYGDANHASTTVLVSYAGVNIWLGGDLHAAGELTAWQASKSSKVHILKAGHHGSNTSTSSEFLAAIQPDYVIFSAGENNRYGHPAPEVLSRVQASGAEVWRTDQQGRITLKISSEGQINIYSSK